MARDEVSCGRCPDLTRRIERLEAELVRARGLTERLTLVEAENRDLRARANLTSRNSSKPPSSDPPSAPPRAPSVPSGRKPGGQPGHKGVTREPFPPKDVDQCVEVRPTKCGACSRALPTSGPTAGVAGRHQVVDIPPITAFVTEYVLHKLVCFGCGSTTEADLPDNVPLGVVGVRIQATAAIMTGRYRMSRREATEAMEALFGPKARFSSGWLSELEGRTSNALEPAYAEAAEAVRSAAFVNADESPFREGRRKAWLWAAVSRGAALFRIDAERSAHAFRRLLGAFKGILGTDRFASYHRHSKQRRQICIAHLKRNFQELVDLGAPASEVGQAGLAAIEGIFKVWNAYETGEIEFTSVASKLRPVRSALLGAVTRGTTNGNKRAAGMCKDLEKLFPCIWTFSRIEGVEPTNNAAERALRPAVLWRKGSFGCHSDRGSRYAERMLTVVHTLRLQGRSVIDFVERALRAVLFNESPPRLLLDSG